MGFNIFEVWGFLDLNENSRSLFPQQILVSLLFEDTEVRPARSGTCLNTTK